MAIITPKTFYNDNLTDSATALYTVPAATTALIKSVVLVETGGAARTVTLYVTYNSKTAYWLKAASLPADGRMVSETPLTLEAGAVVYGAASAAAVVSCIISGAEVT